VRAGVGTALTAISRLIIPYPSQNAAQMPWTARIDGAAIGCRKTRAWVRHS